MNTNLLNNLLFAYSEYQEALFEDLCGGVSKLLLYFLFLVGLSSVDSDSRMIILLYASTLNFVSNRLPFAFARSSVAFARSRVALVTDYKMS